MQSTAQTCVYTPSNVRPGFASKTAKYLGMAQIFLGAICIIFQIVGIILMAWKAFIGAGIWCGAIFVIGGSFGVTSSHRKSNCTIITFMVMSILSAVFTMVPLASCAEAISFDSSYHMSYYRDFGVQSTRVSIPVPLMGL